MIQRLLLTLPLLLSAQVATAQTRVDPSDDLLAAVRALGPGSELILEDGTYTLGPRFGFEALGTEVEPILIRAASGANPVVHRPNAAQNIWDFRGTHLTIRGLAFSGGSAGLRVEGGSDITIEDCEIFDTADVALRMNSVGETYERIRILRNHIHHTSGTGEGMYLGCNNDGCRLADSLIEGNYVHHTDGPAVSQGDGIELKEGSYATTIRDNVIHDTNYPCLLGYSTAGNGARNVVEGNVMWNCGDHGIQWEANAVLRNNIVLGAAQAAMASQPHQAMGPNDLEIVHNTFINTGDVLTIRSASGTVVIANNAVYSRDGRAIFFNGTGPTPTASGNAGAGAVQGLAASFIPGAMRTDFLGATFLGAIPQSVYPTSTGVLAGAGDPVYAARVDFDGHLRMGIADIGAYRVGTGPAWEIMEGFKASETPVVPGGDGGMSDAGSLDSGLGDAGPIDAGAGDAAVVDAGRSVDASVALPDAGARDGSWGAEDAGTPSSSSGGGCSCSTGGSRGIPMSAFAVLALSLGFSRRRSGPVA